jgi:hypothetical protein
MTLLRLSWEPSHAAPFHYRSARIVPNSLDFRAYASGGGRSARIASSMDYGM